MLVLLVILKKPIPGDNTTLHDIKVYVLILTCANPIIQLLLSTLELLYKLPGLSPVVNVIILPDKAVN